MKYGMFTSKGNQLVHALVKKVIKLPMSTTSNELQETISTGFNKIADQGHDEVWDTDVREQAIGEIEKLTQRKLSIFF